MENEKVEPFFKEILLIIERACYTLAPEDYLKLLQALQQNAQMESEVVAHIIQKISPDTWANSIKHDTV